MPQSSLPQSPRPRRNAIPRTFSENVIGYLTALPDRLQSTKLSVFGPFLSGRQRLKPDPSLDTSLGLEDIDQDIDQEDGLDANAVTQFSHRSRRSDGQKGCGKCITCINGRECLKEVAFEGCGRCLCCFNNRRCLLLDPLPGQLDGGKSYSKYMQPGDTLDDVVVFEQSQASADQQTQVDHEAIKEWLQSVNVVLAQNIGAPRRRTVKTESAKDDDVRSTTVTRMLPKGLKNLKVRVIGEETSVSKVEAISQSTTVASRLSPSPSRISRFPSTPQKHLSLQSADSTSSSPAESPIPNMS